MILHAYRVALRALPEWLRRKHGAAMESLFRVELDKAAEVGRFHAIAVGTRGILDAVRRGVYERRRARRTVKGRGKARGELWEGEGWMNAFRQDLSQATRSLVKAPRFAVVAIVTLALGIGANSAIFSVMNGTMFRGLPFPASDRFVHLAWDYGDGPRGAVSPIKVEYYGERSRSFAAFATYRGFLARFDRGDEVLGVPGLRVSRGFLSVVGFEPSIGRDFTAEEDSPDGPDVALVSAEFRKTHLADVPDVVGQTIRISDQPYTIVGVLPEEFAFPQQSEPPQILVPLGLRADPADEGANYPIIARLRDGVTREAAQADLTSLDEGFRSTYPNQIYERDRGMRVASFEAIYFKGVGRALWMVFGAAAVVLLIACANVANLMLARATQRKREMAVRAALGASRARVTRLVLTESALVSVVAGLMGLAFAHWSVGVLVRIAPSNLPRLDGVGVDWRVFAFAMMSALVTGIVFGGFAAVPAVRTGLTEVLNEGQRGSSGRGRARQGLLMVQAAMSMMLLVGAALLVTTLSGLRSVDPGFDWEGLTAIRFPFRPTALATAEDLWELERRVGEEFSNTPGITDLVGASNLPLERGLNLPVSIGGRPDDFEGAVEWRAVTPSYFDGLQIDVVAGRGFGPGDEKGASPVAIVNEAFVRRYFADMNPIGQRVEVGRYKGKFVAPQLEGPGAEIIGVAADVRDVSLRREPARTIYVPQAQAPTILSRMPVFLVRGRLGAGETERIVRDGFRRVDPRLPRPDVVPMSEIVGASLTQERFGAFLMSTFAGLALLLTAFGIYGVLAYTVRQRRREIGIRVALGAGRSSVARLVAVQGITPILLGLVVGTVAALALSEVVSSLVWGVSATDPAMIVVVGVVLIVVAALAAWAPVSEALSADPVESLAEE